jgi:hypothetical protein
MTIVWITSVEMDNFGHRRAFYVDEREVVRSVRITQGEYETMSAALAEMDAVGYEIEDSKDVAVEHVVKSSEEASAT